MTTPPTTTAPAGVQPNLATVGLTKRFGGVTAVDDATVTFHHGKVNALIGPNGSGKTTFFNCVTGKIRHSWKLRPMPARATRWDALPVMSRPR